MKSVRGIVIAGAVCVAYGGAVFRRRASGMGLRFSAGTRGAGSSSGRPRSGARARHHAAPSSRQ